ncbi:hypothetical protein SAMN05428949_1796 [Chitinophaga sp. YR627]|uniref:hypothetical protein n=1 Tax=Chitinophaga sp. YR627 TaxID=1881041 RepID=UPI0008EDCB27|nr:hypothetical protein [Chitinophaga sp. YR627]SFN18008.1 hypothetical protein SAMN05428949_1796 [Chitinophaga sp. YR627]
MKKSLLLASIFLAGLKPIFAQHFSHGIGVGIFVADSKTTDARGSFAFTYSPRYNFVEMENASLSVGIPLSVGFSGSYSATYNSYDGYYEDNSLGYMINVPLIVNFNFGAGSFKGNKQKFGFFAGGGYALHTGTTDYIAFDDYGSYTDSETRTTTGPVANAGMRIGLGRRKTHNLEIKTSYMKGIGDYNPDIFAVGCLFNF